MSALRLKLLRLNMKELIVRCSLVIILVAVNQQMGQSYKLDYLN